MEEKMKPGLQQILKISGVLFILSFFCGFVLGQPGNGNQVSIDKLYSFGLEEMYRFVLDQLPRLLESIPINEEEKHGFKSREEFKIAVPGIPYQEYSLDKDMPTGYWIIPVTVTNENRVLMRLKKQKDKWEFAGFGATRLATELGFFETHAATGKPSWGRIVRDFEMNCDYLQFEPGSAAKLEGLMHPLESAARILLRLHDSIDKKGYKVSEIKEFRLQLREIPGEKNPGKTN
jgi:hypothetical protein